MRAMPRDPYDDPPQARARAKPGAVPTIGALMREHQGNWVWVYCRNPACGHYRAVALAPLAIRWGCSPHPTRSASACAAPPAAPRA